MVVFQGPCPSCTKSSLQRLLFGARDVTPKTQKGPKHEKYIPKVPVDFSFLKIQSK